MTNEELFAVIKKNPISVGCAVLCIALGAGIYFRRGEIPEAEAELAQKTAEADRYASNIKNSVQLKEDVDALAAANKEIDTRIIRAGQLPANLQFFYKLFGESGVKSLDLRQGGLSSTKGKTYTPVMFSVSVSGDLNQIMHFLTLLESGARYVRVLTANCTVPSDRNGPLTLALNLELLGVP